MDDPTEEGEEPCLADFLPRTMGFYQSAERTTHTVERRGMYWSVTYIAKWDGHGYLVKTAEWAPAPKLSAPLREGDSLLVRVKMVEDQGAVLQVRAEFENCSQAFWVDRRSVVSVD